MDSSSKNHNGERKIKFRPNTLSSKKENAKWLIIIILISFILSAVMSISSSNALQNSNIITALLLVLLIIIIGIFFDIIGIAVTAADETPFHAMASRKLYGARQSIMLIRNANKVSSFCNDVVGDICGVISGSASAFIILTVSKSADASETTVAGVVISGLVAALTVGGKALGKTAAIENSNYIVYRVGVIIKFILDRIKFIKLYTKPKER